MSLPEGGPCLSNEWTGFEKMPPQQKKQLKFESLRSLIAVFFSFRAINSLRIFERSSYSLAFERLLLYLEHMGKSCLHCIWHWLQKGTIVFEHSSLDLHTSLWDEYKYFGGDAQDMKIIFVYPESIRMPYRSCLYKDHLNPFYLPQAELEIEALTGVAVFPHPTQSL